MAGRMKSPLLEPLLVLRHTETRRSPWSRPANVRRCCTSKRPPPPPAGPPRLPARPPPSTSTLELASR